MFTTISNAQAKAVIDSEQIFAAYRDLSSQWVDYEGGIHWKKISGKEYLYRTSDRKGNGRSMGVKSPATESIFLTFSSRKEVLSSRLKDLRSRLELQSKLNVVYRAGHAQNQVADICEQLDRAQLFGQNLMVIGTNALYAYEAMAGVRFQSDILATVDIDLLWNHTSRLRIATTKAMDKEGLLGLLRKADKSYEIVKTQPFRAVSKSGYMVDLIRQMPSPPWASEPDRFFDQDMVATDIWNMKWLLGAPKIDQPVIAGDGRIFMMTVPDPRAFVMFKLWLSQSDERDPLKKQRDAAQAIALIDVIEQKLPHLNANWKAIKSFPLDVVDSAVVRIERHRFS